MSEVFWCAFAFYVIAAALLLFGVVPMLSPTKVAKKTDLALTGARLRAHLAAQRLKFESAYRLRILVGVLRVVETCVEARLRWRVFCNDSCDRRESLELSIVTESVT